MSKEIIDSGKKVGRTYWERMRVGNGVILEDKIARLNKKVILEIGPSETPFPIYGEKGVKEGECYIGMDISPDKVKETVNLFDLVGFPKDKFTMIGGGVREFIRRDRSIEKVKFPLRDGSVNEVLMCNVVDDPRVMENIEEIMEESARVLDPKVKLL